MSILVRKFKTVVTNPKDVIKKYVFGQSKKNNKKIESNVKSIKKIDRINITPGLSTPRLVYCIELIDNKLHIKRNDKVIHNPNFFTVIFLENKSLVTKCELSSMINATIKYISFREKTLFFADVKCSDEFCLYTETRNEVWRSNPFEGLKNAIYVNPKSKISELVKYTSHSVLNIAYFDFKPKYEQLIDFDFVVIDKSVGDIEHHNYIVVEDYVSACEEIGRFCNYNGSRPHDMLIPVVGEFDFTDHIDILNKKDIDIVFKLNEKVKAKSLPFNDSIKLLSNNVDAILMKESKSVLYRKLILSSDKEELLKTSLKNGLRMEVI